MQSKVVGIVFECFIGKYLVDNVQLLSFLCSDLIIQKIEFFGFGDVDQLGQSLVFIIIVVQFNIVECGGKEGVFIGDV